MVEFNVDCINLEFAVSAVMSDLPRPHRITVDEYYRMAEVGLLAPDARVELIDGVIIDMAPIGNQHRSKTIRLDRLLQRILGDRALVICQSSVRFDRFNQPEPDFALVKFREDFYENRHPAAEDIFLIIEVSDSTLHYDRKEKLALYANHAIPEYWILDIANKQLHVFRDCSAGKYQDTFMIDEPRSISPVRLPDVSLNWSELFD